MPLGNLSTLPVGQVRNHVPVVSQHLAKEVFVAKLKGLCQLHIFGAVLHEEMEDILMAEVASHLVRSALAPEGWNVVDTNTTRISLRKILFRDSRADGVRISSEMPCARDRNHQVLRP
jgi:hypothetical protein